MCIGKRKYNFAKPIQIKHFQLKQVSWKILSVYVVDQDGRSWRKLARGPSKPYFVANLSIREVPAEIQMEFCQIAFQLVVKTFLDIEG